MKKFLCVLLSAILISGIFTAVPLGADAASEKKVKLKKSSAVIYITTSSEGNKSFGSTKITLTKLKGVKIKKITYKSSDKSIAKVSKKGKVTAVKKGGATVKVKVKYTYKKKSYKKNLNFKVKVKNESSFYKKLSAFSNKLYTLSSNDEKNNYTMSPVSVYMALSMLYSSGDAGVKADVKKLVGMNDSDIAETGKLFKKLNKKYDDGKGNIAAQLNLTNSIWFDKNETLNPDALSKFEKELYCNAFSTPFKDDIKTANKEIREFIKKQTNGLIDKDFDLQPDTLLALINTLYFKDVWEDGIDLSTEKKEFKFSEGNKKIDFLIGHYNKGRVQETDNAEYFFTKTEHGYKIKFIKPKSGYTLSQAMSAKNLNKINKRTDYKFKEGNTEHYTRCIFPSFKIESETPLKDILAGNGYLKNAFYEFNSPLTEKPLCVSDIKHNTVIDVNKKGVEGAAVTIFAVKCASALVTTKRVNHDFTLNKNFGFIITDPNDVILFEGQVTNPNK